jgi:hypothetical protein
LRPLDLLACSKLATHTKRQDEYAAPVATRPRALKRR